MQDKRTFFLYSITFRFLKLQPSDTAYPRFKSRLAQSELERFYTVTDVDWHVAIAPPDQALRAWDLPCY
jgi:hypothetical protein